MKATLILERLDKDYKLLERRELPSRSFVLGFIKLLYVAHAQIQSTSPYSLNDITNAPRDIDSQNAAGRFSKGTLKVGSTPGSSEQIVVGATTATAPAAPTYIIEGEKLGIVVGTGVGAVTPTDVALGTRILHGTGGGLFEYGGCELINLVFAGANGELTIRRYFTNNSGGLITVQEAGIYAAGTMYVAGTWGGSSWPFCIARDITGAVPVNNTEILRATYVVQITV